MSQPRSTNDLQGHGGDAVFGPGTGDYMPTRTPARPPDDWSSTGQGEAVDDPGGFEDEEE